MTAAMTQTSSKQSINTQRARYSNETVATGDGLFSSYRPCPQLSYTNDTRNISLVLTRATLCYASVALAVAQCLRHGTGSHFVTQRPSDPGIQ